MALTQIKAAALTADLIDETKLADNSIDSEHYNDGSIDVAHIADDQITNAKVNSSAAIAGSKISPDFGSQNVISTGTSNALGTTTIKGGSNAAARLLLQNTTSVRTNYIGLSGDDDRIVIAADDADQGSNSTIDFKVDGTERMNIDSSGALTVSSTTDGAMNLDTTDARGPFIRYKVSGTSKVFAGCGEGLGLGSEDDFGIRTDAHLRIRTGTEEHAMLTDEGFFAAKGMAGGWISSQSPASTQSHQFNNTGVSNWVCQFQQQHHAGFGVQILGNSTSNSEAFVIYSNSNNTTRFRVLWDGNCANANNSFGSLSDISIKENIVDAKSQWDDIKAVKVRNFNLKNDPDTKMLGVVAQEIETVSPKLVWEDGEGLKGVSYSVLYMKAIKCLQEAMAKIETLETKVAALEAK